MNTGRGWWTAVGCGVLTLLCLYVGTYFATVSVVDLADSGPPLTVAIYPECQWLSLRSFFEPIHQIDRMLRPQVWYPPLP